MKPGDFKKKRKFGMLPGDLSLGTKIRMMEARGEERENVHRSFKKDHVKQANRFVRRMPIPSEDEW